MKKIIISLLIVAAFAGYLLYYRRIPETVVTNPTPIDTPTSSVKPGATRTPVSGQYKDGSYTGSVADAFYGNVQVRATVSGGKLTDVAFLQYPSEQGHSLEISNYAMPILKSEAITAQSANVDIVSGATQTSEAFQQSLAAALALAR